MQRVLHLLSSLEIGGKERVVLELARRARAEGLDHRLLLFDRSLDPARDFDPGDVHWSFLARGSGLDLRFARALARELCRLAADGVHAHNDTAIVYAALAARLVRRSGGGRPFVIGTFHTRPGHDTRAARVLTRWATRLVDGVTCVSDELAQRLLALGWTRPAQVIWNGVDAERFAPAGPAETHASWRARLGVASAAFLVGLVGRHDPIKRQQDLLAACRRLVAEGLELALVLVGEGPLRAALERDCAGEPWVRCVPRADDVAGLLRSLDAFVLCSDHEAAPRALMEAMSCGRACVATAVGGVPTLARGPAGETVLLVPPRRPDALAEALARLAREPRLRAALGARARERMRAFSAEATWEAYRALYRRGGSQAP